MIEGLETSPKQELEKEQAAWAPPPMTYEVGAD